MAHGSREGVLCCNGEIVSVDEIVSIVSKAGINLDMRKLIFIQACRGDNHMFRVPSQPPSPVEHPSRGDKEGTSMMHLQSISRNTVESDKGTLPDPFPDTERDSDSNSQRTSLS